MTEDDIKDNAWRKVSKVGGNVEDSAGTDNFLSDRLDFLGKNLQDGKFAGESFDDSSFSVSNLANADFSNCSMKGVDFSGADLTGANLSGANLEGAVFANAKLIGTNFTGANLKGVKFTDADIQDAILLDIEIDELGIEELQQIIEYIAKYYPHKLNLTKINLTLLDLSKIDLRQVDLRGVDFTGCDFTGVNIMDLDLSSCIITPAQIAQALGKVPNAEELKKILAPKKKDNRKSGSGLADIFFDNGSEFGVLDLTKSKGIGIDQMLKVGKKVFRHSVAAPSVKDGEFVEKIKEEKKLEEKSHNQEIREAIERRKQQELEARASKKQEFDEVTRIDASQEKVLEEPQRQKESVEKRKEMVHQSRVNIHGRDDR